MENTIQEARSSETGETVRATINERKFFESMKHLFASSYSVLGELMQNARRAGATRVDFTVDIDKKTASVQDDGSGITDFQVVIALCDSGWNEQVQLTDKPFGMGLFSLFFAADTVVFRSNGRSLTVGLDDIINKRELRIKPDPDTAGNAGTRIDLMGLKGAMAAMETTYPPTLRQAVILPRMIAEIRRRAKGFPIPVFVNGVECERPHAQEFLQGVQTPIGFVRYQGVTTADQVIPLTRCRVLYLQGLPIGGREGDQSIVVHLDSTRFTARMPDRSHLFNEVEQDKLIHEALAEMVQVRLFQLKASMDAMRFVIEHWDNCSTHGHMALMNDVPWIPATHLRSVDKVCMAHDEVFYPTRHSTELVCRQDFLTGAVKVWRNVPYSTDAEPLAALHLKVMQHLGVWALTDKLDENHWINDVAPLIDDLRFTWNVTDEEIGGTVFYESIGTCEIRLAKSVTVTVSSSVDERLRHEVPINNDWVMVPAHPESGDEDSSEDKDAWCYATEFDLICYVTGQGPSQDQPVDALSTFTDEHDHYDAEARNRAMNAFSGAVNAMRGSPLSNFVNTALIDAMPELSQKQAHHLCLVRTVQHRDHNGQLRLPTPDVIDLTEDDFWSKVASAMLPSGSETQVQAQADTIRQAFTAVVQPGWQEPAQSNGQ